MKTLALRVLRDYCHQWGVLFAWDLHDGLFFYVPKSQHTKSIVRQMKHTLDTIDYPAYWSGWAPSVPLLWDASLGQSWDTLEELK